MERKQEDSTKTIQGSFEQLSKQVSETLRVGRPTREHEQVTELKGSHDDLAATVKDLAAKLESTLSTINEAKAVSTSVLNHPPQGLFGLISPSDTREVDATIVKVNAHGNPAIDRDFFAALDRVLVENFDPLSSGRD